MKIRTMLFCGALLAIGASCKRDETARVDEKAKQAIEADRDTSHTAINRSGAEADFTANRDAFVDALRLRYKVYATQAASARSMLGDTSLTEKDRAQATERVMVFERELSEAQDAIDAAATATAAQWEPAKTTVENAFDQLQGAATDAMWTLSADRRLERNVSPPAKNPPAKYPGTR